MKVAYIAHPFGGKRENIEDVEKIILKLLPLYSDYTFYSPLHCTGFFYHAISYEAGMEHCFEFLKRADELWLCEEWEESIGCKMEVEYATAHGIPIYLIMDGGELKRLN
jgi:hypothetical protein